MKSDKLKSILAIIAYALIFIVSEIFGELFKVWFPTTILFSLVYPSFAFWIALSLTIVIEIKNFVNRDMFIKACMLSILFLWAASFSMVPVYLPATAFMVEENIPLRWQIFRLPSIALFKSGWFLIIVVILLWYRERTDKDKI